MQAADNEAVLTLKGTLVVDLSGIVSLANYAHIPVGEPALLQKSGTPLNTLVMSKAESSMDSSREHMKTVSVNNWKHVEAEMDVRREHVKTFPLKVNGKQVMGCSEQIQTVALKSNGKQAETVMEFSKEQIKTVSNGKQTEMEISREHIKTAVESPLKPLVGFSPETLRVSPEILRETVF